MSSAAAAFTGSSGLRFSSSTLLLARSTCTLSFAMTVSLPWRFASSSVSFTLARDACASATLPFFPVGSDDLSPCADASNASVTILFMSSLSSAAASAMSASAVAASVLVRASTLLSSISSVASRVSFFTICSVRSADWSFVAVAYPPSTA